MTTEIKPVSTASQNKQARLIALQDDTGYHLCIGFVKSINENGNITFENEGQKILSYGAYEVVIQDLENCLIHAKSMMDTKIKSNDPI